MKYKRVTISFTFTVQVLQRWRKMHNDIVRRLYLQLWNEVILEIYSGEEKGILAVEKSSYTWSCRRKISWIPTALERKVLCQNQAIPTATREGIKDTYSSDDKGILIVGKSSSTWSCGGKVSWIPTAQKEKVPWLAEVRLYIQLWREGILGN